MFRQTRTFRWLLTAVLAFSTSVAGVVPQFAETAFAGRATASQGTPAKACCCGMPTAACCGMGCCSAREAPAPVPGPAPLHEDGSRADASPLGLVWNRVCLQAELFARNSWDRDGHTLDRSLAEATLQSLHVRLDA